MNVMTIQELNDKVRKIAKEKDSKLASWLELAQDCTELLLQATSPLSPLLIPYMAFALRRLEQALLEQGGAEAKMLVDVFDAVIQSTSITVKIPFPKEDKQ